MEDENMCNACLDAGLSRRSLVLAGAGLLSAAPLGGMAQAQPMAAANTPDAALNLLIEGNARYVANQPRECDFSAGRASRSRPSRLRRVNHWRREICNRPSLVCADSSSEILTRSRMWLYRGFWSAAMKGRDYRFPGST
jgi:hypothetical protein